VSKRSSYHRAVRAALASGCTAIVSLARAQGFEKVNTTVVNIEAILVLISVGVVTIAIMWAGFKMLFQGARLADVANWLIGATIIGGAGAFAAYLVN
jgi:type IV secretion system protein VirB2